MDVTTEAPERPPQTIGEYLLAKRGDAGMAQDDLAEKIGFTQGAISAWERGVRVPTVKAVAALARHLPGADVDTMLALIEGQDEA